MLRSVPIATRYLLAALLMASVVRAAEPPAEGTRALSLEVAEEVSAEAAERDPAGAEAGQADQDSSNFDAAIKFPAGDCLATFAYDVAVTKIAEDDQETSMLGRVICGEDFIVHGLTTGRYRIELLQEYATSDDRDWATLNFEVTGRDLTLVVGGR